MNDDNNPYKPKLHHLDVDHARLDFLGVSASIYRNSESGVLGVMINTENTDARDRYGEYDGMPIIEVSLNDGDIYVDYGQDKEQK